MSRPRVFITQDEDRFDFSGLDAYGQRITIFTRSTYPDEVDQRTKWMVDRVRSVFGRRPYDPRYDHIAIVGDMLGVAVVFMVLGSMGLTNVTVLKYDGKEKAYYPATIQLI